MSRGRRAVCWYSACRSFFAVPEALRRDVTRQTLAHYRKIRDLPPDVGEDLDCRAAPFAIFRWIAWGATDAEKRARHAAAVEHHAHSSRWPSPHVLAGTPRAKPRAA